MEQSILFINDALNGEQRSDDTHLRPFSAFHCDSRRQVPVTIIAAVGQNMELGKNGQLIWYIPEDLRHFKQLTLGATVIMGRKTWDSLPRKPLPGRQNIVISGNPDFMPEGAVKASSIAEAIAHAKGNETFIIGGASIYEQAFPLADKLEITHIEDSEAMADTFFPEIDEKEWMLSKISEPLLSPDNIHFRYATYSRRR